MKIYYPHYCTICDNMAKKKSELCEHFRNKHTDESVGIILTSKTVWDQMNISVQQGIFKALGYKKAPKDYLYWEQLSIVKKRKITELFKKDIVKILIKEAKGIKNAKEAAGMIKVITSFH